MTTSNIVQFTTNFGVFKVALNAEKAPLTVENFLQYVKDGFYNGTLFHRVIDKFMIQGGGFESGMKIKPTRDSISNEAKNGLKNEPYAIAMARTGNPHSATSQFFINVNTNRFLDFPGQDGWGYCVFGTVTEGREVIDLIKAVQTKRSGMFADVPIEDVVIEKAELI